MIEKLKALYAVFTAGQMVAHPVLWKKRQISAGMLAGLFGAVVALAKTFGYSIPLTDDQLLQIGGACVALLGLFNGGVTVATTDKLGMSARADGRTDAPSPVDSAVLERLPAVSAPAQAALQPERQPEAGPAEQALRTFPAEPERVNSSFAGGS